MQDFIVRQLFLIVLSLSLSGALIGIFIAAIHPFTGKYFSKKWNYYIWLLVVVRLLLPFHFESNFLRTLNIQAGFSRNHATTQSSSMIQTDDGIQISNSAQTGSTALPDNEKQISNAEPFDGIQQSKQPEVGHSAAMTDTKFSAAYIWLIGAMIALFIKLLNYCRFQNGIKKNCSRITDSRILTMEYIFCSRLRIKKFPAIYESSSVSSPLTIGLWNPVIVIPRVFSDQNTPASLHMEQTLTQFQLVLHHELIHIARKDLLYKWVYQLLLCVHWFNPVLHCVGGQINRDCELSCDEAILSELTETGKQMYGNILLDTAEQNITHRQNAFSTTLLENKKELKKRLDGILHYRKATRSRFVLSACAFVMILALSACSTIWIASDNMSAPESEHSSSVNKNSDSSVTASDSTVVYSKSSDTSVTASDSAAADRDDQTAFHYDDSDEAGAFMQMFSSLVSSDSYVNSFVGPDHSSDAWKVYDDDKLLAGEDIQDNWGAYNYRGGAHKILAYGFVLYGSDSFAIVYADHDIDVKIKSAYDIREGNFKIISIAPDKSVVTLNETGAETTTTVTMKKGRNVLKMVGQGAKVTHLEIDYTDLDASECAYIFYSEDEEYIHLVKNAAAPIDQDRVIRSLCYLDEKDASELFHILLTNGTAFTADELCDFLIFSDATLSNQYLLEALRNQTIRADAALEAMPYLDSPCQTEVLKMLPVEEFYDAFADNIYYLNSSQIEECLTEYINRGGTLTYSMYEEISPYVNSRIAQKLDKLTPIE